MKFDWKALLEKLQASGYLLKAGVAFGVLIVGWIVVYLVQRLVYSALVRTGVESRLAKLMGIDEEGLRTHRLERLTAKTVYYALLAFILVAVFTILGVNAVTQPLLAILDEIAHAVPNLLKAAFIAIAAYIVAMLVRRLIVVALDAVKFDARLAKISDDESKAPETVEETPKKKGAKPPEKKGGPARTIADVAYWLILVVAAIPVFESLEIGAFADPMKGALAKVTAYLPNVGAALVVAVVGYVLARFARTVVAGLLSRLGVDKIIGRLGMDKTLEGTTLSGIAGSIVMAFIMLQFAISAIGRLQIDEITVPASHLLEQVYAYLPKLLVGSAMMVAGVIIGRVAGNITARLVAAIGFNSLMAYVGVVKTHDDAAKKQEEDAKKQLEDRRKAEDRGEVAKLEGLMHEARAIRTPSDVVGVVVTGVVVLVALRQVLATTQLDGLAHMVDSLIAFLPHVFVACVVLGAGLWAGRWAKQRIDELTRRSEDRVARSLGSVARVGIITFASMMALQQLGVGQQLITLAFALLLGAACLAAALAFGLGGREVAGKIVTKEYDRRADREGGGVGKPGAAE